jgi:beta-lactam-binding protein with PASTA domain
VGLVLGSSTTTVDCNSLGLVDKQSPTAGTRVATGSAVSITTGTEPAPPAVCP